jgi:hypothetical protein
MAMQITPEQTDWLSRFLGRNLPAMTPEMAINTAGGAPADDDGQTQAAPGLMERFDAAVNGVGASIFGSAGRMPAPSEAAAPAPEPAPASAPAQSAAPERGILERMDSAVNDFGAAIFGSAGRMPAPSSAATPAPEPPPPSAPAPEATPERSILERMDSAVNDFGAAIFGSAGRVE